MSRCRQLCSCDQLPRFGECGGELCGQFAAGLGEIGTAAAAAAGDFRHLADDVARVQAVGEIFAHFHREAGFVVD